MTEVTDLREPFSNLPPEKGMRLVIVDGRYVGLARLDRSDCQDGVPKVVELEDALEICSAMFPQQTKLGFGTVRVSMVHPIAMCQGPKRLSVRCSMILFADTDLDQQERQSLQQSIKNCLENIQATKMQRETGLILPKG